MTRKLAEVEHDRAIMLAGISHDLRTPLARLRLETELSVADPEARNHMASDIAQVDAIIEKFLDYARPGRVRLVPVLLRSTIEGKLYALDQQDDIRVRVDLPDDLMVLAEEVELGRVISNLLENARRYGRSVDTGVAQVEISAWANGPWVTVEVRDHGAGVSFDQLAQLTQPFYRGDLARTDASGTGLGLAVVKKIADEHGARVRIVNLPAVLGQAGAPGGAQVSLSFSGFTEQGNPPPRNGAAETLGA
eukprot:gene43543-57977_t